MESTTFLVMCFIAAVPLATGLKCYVCSGSSIGPVLDCYDAVTDKLEAIECGVSVTTCKQVKVETSPSIGDDYTTITRSCGESGKSAKAECDETDVDVLFASVETTVCYCGGDKCNGQTTLSPTIITCVVSLVLALFKLQ